MAAVALVMLPALFLLGRAVDSAFSKPCDTQELSDACAVNGSGTDGGDSGGGAQRDAESTTEPAPAGLGNRVVEQIRESDTAVSSASCDEPVRVTDTDRSTTCLVAFDDGREQRYQARWTDPDTVEVTPL
jgi:hypothetical protein